MRTTEARVFYRGFFIFRPKKKRRGGTNPFAKQRFYNLSLFLACMILLMIFSVRILLFGNLSMALIILASAFHLSCKYLGPTVIDVMLFGDLVQSIDAGIAALQALFEFGARPHVLIAGPVKFDPRLAQQFLNVKTKSLSSLGSVGPSPSHNLKVDFVSVSCPRPNLPNRWKVSIVQPLSSSSSFLDWVLLQTY